MAGAIAPAIFMHTHLLDAFEHQVRNRPEAVALVVPREGGQSPRSYCWQQLGRMVDDVSAFFSQVWCDQPDLPRRFGHASDNTLADVLIPLAAMSQRVVEVPIDHRLAEEDIQARWNRVDGYWLESSDRMTLVERAKSHASETAVSWSSAHSTAADRDELSLILWTSGTTGRPQGVMLSQRNLCGNAAAKLAAVPQAPDDVRLCVLPLCHAYARTCDFGTWLLSGCTLALTLGFEGWRQLAPMVRPTLANTVPGLADRLLRGDSRELGLHRLKLIGCGGAAMSGASFAAWRDSGVTVIQGYGLTETSPVICSATPDNACPELVGHFVDGWEHRIGDGRLWVRGPHVMLGYWDDERAMAEKIDADGWLDTGDLVEIDRATGQLRICGRVDDVLVLASGRKFNPWPIEREVEQIEGVRHALLIEISGSLELWIDGDIDVESQAFAEFCSQNPRWPRPFRVKAFTPPLSLARGELTAKGTKRRERIRQMRFPLSR